MHGRFQGITYLQCRMDDCCCWGVFLVDKVLDALCNFFFRFVSLCFANQAIEFLFMQFVIG